MSLINRVSISNFMNINGAGSHLPWEPRFRYEIMNFYGQSTAINARNGCGKTSVVKALLALLSRNKTHVRDTHEKMAPRSFGIPSHIRIEFVSPDERYSGQPDMLINQGEGLSGEKWVFGISGFRLGDKNDELDYYFYHGTLEDCPPGIYHDKNKVTLRTPSDFDDSRKQLDKFWWRPKQDLWLKFMSHHVSLKAMKKLADFQRKGSSDKGVDLFKFKIPPGEKLDEAFFYEIIAPEILAGAMDAFGEEDEDDIEEVIFNTVQSAINAKKKAITKRVELNQLKHSLDLVDIVVTHAKQSKIDLDNYKIKLSSIAGAASFLKDLVVSHPFLGIPSNNIPDGAMGDVAKYIVIEPGEVCPCVLASGLSILIGDEPKHIRQKAERKNIYGRKIPRTVENTCDLLSVSAFDVGQKPISYTLDQAHKIIDSSTKFINGMDKQKSHKVLNDAFTWYSEEGDRNPYRKDLFELNHSQTTLAKDIESIEGEIEFLDGQKEELRQNERQMNTNEGAYDKLLQSGLFSESELNKPLDTAKEVKVKIITTERALTEFKNKRSRLSVWKDDWHLFISDYGEDESPHTIEKTKTKEKQKHESQINTINKELSTLNSDVQSAQTSIHEIEVQEAKLQAEHKKFERLIPDMAHFTALFGEADPDTLESDLLDEKRNCESTKKELEGEITRLNASLQNLIEFQNEFGTEAVPSLQLEILNKERTQITIEEQSLNNDLISLNRKKKELDTEKVAAGDTEDQARILLKSSSIEYNPLYKTIESFGLTSVRKKDVLISLSSLLISPVFIDHKTGEQAASLLAKENIPVPVISFVELELFCKNNEPDNLNGAGSIFIGIVTPAIKCLLDPEFLEKEKQKIIQQISVTKTNLSIIEARIVEIGAESPLMVLIRAAEDAEKEDAKSLLTTVSLDLSKIKDRLLEIAPKVTNQAINRIRSALEIKSMGGLNRYDLIKSETSDLQESYEDKNTQLGLLNDSITTITTTKDSLEEEGKYILPSSLQFILLNSQHYFDNNGPSFEATENEENKRLQAEKSSASARNDYYGWFEAAHAYLKSRNLGEGKTIQDQITDLCNQHSEACSELNTLKSEFGVNEGYIPKTKEMITILDDLAIEITGRYKKIVIFTKDIECDTAVMHTDMKNALQTAEKVMCLSLKDKEMIHQGIIQISDEVCSIDVTEGITELNRQRKNLSQTESNLLQSASLAIQEQGLAAAEKEILSSIKGSQDADVVENMWKRLQNVYAKEEADLSMVEERESETRDTVSGRLNYFIQRGASNLTLFKRLARKNYGDLKSNFIIDAEIISEEASERLVLEIIDIFEEDERSRSNLKEKGISVPNIESYKKSLEEKIQAMIYRRVFTNPSIYFEMEAIRKKGKHLIDSSLSEGEKSAISLMWAIRLADFAVEKDARNQRGNTGRNKARSLSENILILDGLFSDLSATDLIKSSMAGLERTRGKFQLIGLIHDEHYDNDFSIFPNLLLGKLNQSLGDTGGWVSFENKDKNDRSVGFAQINSINTNGTSNGV